MATERVGDMTLDELNKLIEAAVDRHIQQVQVRRDDKRTMAEVNASIRHNRIVPPPGGKSARQLLCEDRDA